MSKHTQNFKTMLDLAVARGLFNTAEAVAEMHEGIKYFIFIEDDLKRLSNINQELQAKSERLKLLYPEGIRNGICPENPSGVREDA
jgi:hypothetical protein